MTTQTDASCDQRKSPSRRPSIGGFQRLHQIAFQPHENRLRLRIAKAAVELQHHRAPRRHHQTAVQDALILGAFRLHAGHHRTRDMVEPASRASRHPRSSGWSMRPCRRCWDRCRRRRRACGPARPPAALLARRRSTRETRVRRLPDIPPAPRGPASPTILPLSISRGERHPPWSWR